MQSLRAPGPGGAPGREAKAEDSARKAPVKWPSPHLRLGHHWRSLPVRPGPSPLLGRVLGFGSRVPGGPPEPQWRPWGRANDLIC